MISARTRWILLAFFLLFCLLGLQYRLWVGEGSLAHVTRLKASVHKQETENQRLRERNQLLEAEVEALKHSQDAIEARARGDLGMIKEGETFYMIVDPEGERGESNVSSGAQ